ncbi:MAG: acetolactate synthase small subunit [bacterium]
MPNNNKHTISVLVENEFGVLARVSGMFAARGYNIDSLSVATTLDPKFSHITLVTSGSPEIIEQILKQLNRLIDVVKVQDLTGENFLNRETILAKVKADEKKSPDLLKLIESYGAEKVDSNASSLLLQLTGEGEKVEEFVKKLEPFGILKLIRTGTIAISREED